MWGNCKRKVYGHQHRAHGRHPFSVYSDMIDRQEWSCGKHTHSRQWRYRKLVDGFEGKGSYVQNDLYLGQEWAVSRKYLSFPLSLHIASSLSNTIVKVVCFSVLTTQQQAGGYHVTAFSCCIRVEPLQLISKSAVPHWNRLSVIQLRFHLYINRHHLRSIEA